MAGRKFAKLLVIDVRFFRMFALVYKYGIVEEINIPAEST